jgi:hypothetical protein
MTPVSASEMSIRVQDNMKNSVREKVPIVG